MRHFVGFMVGFVSAAFVGYAAPVVTPPVVLKAQTADGGFAVAINQGGTLSTDTPTAGAVCYGSGSAYRFSAAGSLGDCLKSGGSGAPTWGSCSSISAYSTIQDEGTPLTQRTVLNFAGSITCVDNAGASRTDCTIAAMPPGGAAQSVQFNAGDGGFGGAATTFITDAGTIGITSVTSQANPLAPAANTLSVFAQTHAGRSTVSWTGDPSALDTHGQSAIWDNAEAFTNFSGASAGKSDYGWATTAVGTAAAATFASTNLSTSIIRGVWSTAAPASSPAEVRVSSALTYHRGAAAGLGGWFCSWAWTNPAHVAASDKMLAGLTNSTAALAGTAVPSAQTNVLYAGWDATQTTVSLCGNDAAGTATCASCGANFPATSTTAVYRLYMYAAPNAASVTLDLRRIDDTTIAPCVTTISAAADLPANTLFLAPRIWFSNGTVGGATAMAFINMYCEVDN